MNNKPTLTVIMSPRVTACWLASGIPTINQTIKRIGEIKEECKSLNLESHSRVVRQVIVH